MIIHFEDEHFIIVQKQPKVPCQSDETGDMDLCTDLENFINSRDNNKGKSKTNLYVVHRLDRPVGGIIAYAKSKLSADKLTKLIKERSFKKTYLCVACGEPDEKSASLVHHLKKKAGQNFSVSVHKNNEGAKEAKLSYFTLETVQIKREALSLLKVNLETGRHHQIRVQLSTANLPLWGDAKYHPNARRKRNWTQIALWSHRLEFIHPFSKKPISIVDMPPRIEPWTFFADSLNEQSDKTV